MLDFINKIIISSSLPYKYLVRYFLGTHCILYNFVLPLFFTTKYLLCFHFVYRSYDVVIQKDRYIGRYSLISFFIVFSCSIFLSSSSKLLMLKEIEEIRNRQNIIVIEYRLHELLEIKKPTIIYQKQKK